MLNEVNALHKCDSNKNIVKMVDHSYESIATDGQGNKFACAFIALELLPKGDLFDFVQISLFSEDLIRYCLRQILEATWRMKLEGFVHLDLKLENLMLDMDMNIKVCDFGFAQDSVGPNQDGLLTCFCGTKNYMSPQIFYKTPFFGEQADLFAIGVCAFAMRAGCFPWHTATDKDPYFSVLSYSGAEAFFEKHESRLGGEIYFSDELKDFLA